MVGEGAPGRSGQLSKVMVREGGQVGCNSRRDRLRPEVSNRHSGGSPLTSLVDPGLDLCVDHLGRIGSGILGSVHPLQIPDCSHEGWDGQAS